MIGEAHNRTYEPRPDAANLAVAAEVLEAVDVQVEHLLRFVDNPSYLRTACLTDDAPDGGLGTIQVETAHDRRRTASRVQLWLPYTDTSGIARHCSIELGKTPGEAWGLSFFARGYAGSYADLVAPFAANSNELSDGIGSFMGLTAEALIKEETMDDSSLLLPDMNADRMAKLIAGINTDLDAFGVPTTYDIRYTEPSDIGEGIYVAARGNLPGPDGQRTPEVDMPLKHTVVEVPGQFCYRRTTTHGTVLEHTFTAFDEATALIAAGANAGRLAMGSDVLDAVYPATQVTDQHVQHVADTLKELVNAQYTQLFQ